MSSPPPPRNIEEDLHKNEEEKPAPELDDADIPVDPLLTLLYIRHTLTSPWSSSEERETAKAAMMEEMEKHNMAPYIRLVCEALGVPLDESKLAEMDAINAKKVAAFDARLKDAVDNLGDTEVRDVLQAKCDHYARIGDLEMCMKTNEECAAKTLATGPKLDLYFQRIRLGIAFSDNDIAAKGITDAHRLMKDGDWERRNRLRVYEGIYHVFIRDFQRGSALLLDSITTFAAGELLTFQDFVFITVVASLPVLSRPELRKRIVYSPEVNRTGVDDVRELVNSIYDCQYNKVFPNLEVVCQHLRKVVYLSPHVSYFFREMRVLVFTQFLDSYSSVTLESMGAAFGIPVPALDSMLCTLISNERIACKVDRVDGSVETYRGDTTNFDYHRIVKSGDLLLNRIQKLSRLVDM
ncbi:proteasome regulatory non-ATP-ase subunit [Leishmania donovani]|uniref:Proteasome_regulatory_non-ATP-ase_subunit_-_putative n=3 Tax=Leishmania donovani species complex TaxID=38574 RepID=A0A6L0XPA8_LEIIN|nr:putative proteasome regulatory non-ATP-ase subunit [Leishmania infantum JPCM5]TPP47301.1 26S proteasome subunit RPN7 family protein [Leishmania donovani]CAC9526978.1 proteasome_regulatory_non-ATP-ase_subunit_-_putative [Leishmania infantum]CAJ1991832.1 proteasome regulatory non-ATP-ase subunit [Leishmania donovani]CAM71044.1 putative proteasome regulatory non-ATP-ase subunit [Leishmania infantum JPCM5]SUZ44867.1 proteasome_regulatory_non-ATP-ase_subunit_-_putative [Leishmania infantum]|eukprot:XP_001467972.1 putative proteasome regulatory non-ATP-ase subunit [Leishmania infantum JPCM5]